MTTTLSHEKYATMDAAREAWCMTPTEETWTAYALAKAEYDAARGAEDLGVRALQIAAARARLGM